LGGEGARPRRSRLKIKKEKKTQEKDPIHHVEEGGEEVQKKRERARAVESKGWQNKGGQLDEDETAFEQVEKSPRKGG